MVNKKFGSNYFGCPLIKASLIQDHQTQAVCMKKLDLATVFLHKISDYLTGIKNLGIKM